MILPPFEGPRLKIRRARKHIAELDAILADFGSRVRVHYVPVVENETHVEYVLTFSEEPSADVPAIIGDAIHNLRAALDIMICDIARLRNKSTDKLKFPFAENEEKLADTIKKGVLRIGDDVADAVAALQPYKGGNEALRGLHDLDIDDKHETVLPIYTTLQTQLQLPDIARSMFIQHFGIDLGAMVTNFNQGSRVTVRKNLSPWVMQRPTSNAPIAIFPDNLPFGGKPILEVLSALAQYVDELVESFSGKFGNWNAPTA